MEQDAKARGSNVYKDKTYKTLWKKLKEESFLLYEDINGRRQDVQHLTQTEVLKIAGTVTQLNQSKISFLPARQNQAPADRDIYSEVEIDFMEALKGCSKPVKVERNRVCATCEGSLVAPQALGKKCS